MLNWFWLKITYSIVWFQTKHDIHDQVIPSFHPSFSHSQVEQTAILMNSASEQLTSRSPLCEWPSRRSSIHTIAIHSHWLSWWNTAIYAIILFLYVFAGFSGRCPLYVHIFSNVWPFACEGLCQSGLGFQAPAQPPNGIIVSLARYATAGPPWMIIPSGWKWIWTWHAAGLKHPAIQESRHIHIHINIHIFIYTVPCLVLGHIYIYNMTTPK